MMTSLSWARWCMSVRKQRSNCLHFWPAQSSRRASTFAQAVLFSGSVRISARSPASVVFSHSRMIWKSVYLFQPAQHRRALGIVDLLAARVVPTAFHVADLQGRGKVLLEERTSLKKSCSCRFFVPVEITTRRPERMAGIR